MRADICDPDDAAAVERFRAVLRDLGAGLAHEEWGLGVSVYRVQIAGEELTVYSDTWSIDIDGPDALVRKVLDALGGRHSRS